MDKRISIITGSKHSGKTTELLKIIEKMQLSKKKVAGIISRGTFKNNKRHSFFVQDIESKNEQLLMSIEPVNKSSKIGKFYINNDAFDWGKSILKEAILSNADVIVIDEIGRLEIDDQGWADIIPVILKSEKEIFFIVREEWLRTFINKYNIKEYNSLAF